MTIDAKPACTPTLLGFVFKQKQPDGYWKAVQAGSWYLTSAEERYAMVELKLLAIAWAWQKTAAFAKGINFMIVTNPRSNTSVSSVFA